MADLLEEISVSRIAARFHLGLADAVCRMAVRLAAGHGVDTVALSGGVFQNRTLFERVVEGLRDAGLTPLSHRQIPTNDGGLALGQALIAAAGQIGSVENC